MKLKASSIIFYLFTLNLILLNNLNAGFFSVDLSITSDPPGATIFVDDKEKGKTDTLITLEKRKDPYVIRVELDGYDTEESKFYSRLESRLVEFKLIKINTTKSYALDTDPDGAEVFLNGDNVGSTPLSIDIEFNRSDKNSKWDEHKIEFRLKNYQEETIFLSKVDRSPDIIELSQIQTKKLLKFNTEPEDASVYLNNSLLGKTPLATDVEFYRDDGSAAWDKHKIEFRLKDYQTESIFISSNQPPPNTVKLSQLRLKNRLKFNTEPTGAEVFLGNKLIGKTPINEPVFFERQNKNYNWPIKSLEIKLKNYQTASFDYDIDKYFPSTIKLKRLKEGKIFKVRTFTEDKQPLGAEFVLYEKSNSKEFARGKTKPDEPYEIEINFERNDDKTDWPIFEIKAELQTKYYPKIQKIEYDSDQKIDIYLEPILEIIVEKAFPEVIMKPNGATYEVSHIKLLGMLSTSEGSNSSISNLKAITRHKRADRYPSPRKECINSYTLTPNGQQIIYSITEKTSIEKDTYAASLYIKQSSDDTGGVSKLTQQARYLDTNPVIGLDGKNILIFQSNRSVRKKSDIYRAKLVDNRFTGGIARITADTSYNYSPTYSNSNDVIAYVSTEPDFPTALPQISTINFDGSLSTQLMVTGENTNFSHPDNIYFVRDDATTKKKQIYSIEPDGKLEKTLIQIESFSQSNCLNPAPNPDGSKILFVSDQGTDTKERHNNDIYIMNSDGTNIQRLTENGSDDILPKWSPTETGVIFFLSNRGGAYNIWRMHLITGT